MSELLELKNEELDSIGAGHGSFTLVQFGNQFLNGVAEQALYIHNDIGMASGLNLVLVGGGPS